VANFFYKVGVASFFLIQSIGIDENISVNISVTIFYLANFS